MLKLNLLPYIYVDILYIRHTLICPTANDYSFKIQLLSNAVD